MLSYFSNELLCCQLFPQWMLEDICFYLQRAMDSAQVPSGHSAAVARKFELLCRFHTENWEHCFAPHCCNPAWIWLLFGDVSAYPLSVEMIPPLILVFCLTRVYLEQAVCSANTPAFLHCISSWKECILLGLCSCIYVFLVSFFHKAFFWWAKVKY